MAQAIVDNYDAVTCQKRMILASEAIHLHNSADSLLRKRRLISIKEGVNVLTRSHFSHPRQENGDIFSVFFTLRTNPSHLYRFQCRVRRRPLSRTVQVIEAQPDQVWFH